MTIEDIRINAEAGVLVNPEVALALLDVIARYERALKFVAAGGSDWVLRKVARDALKEEK